MTLPDAKVDALVASMSDEQLERMVTSLENVQIDLRLNLFEFLYVKQALEYMRDEGHTEPPAEAYSASVLVKLAEIKKRLDFAAM